MLQGKMRVGRKGGGDCSAIDFVVNIMVLYKVFDPPLCLALFSQGYLGAVSINFYSVSGILGAQFHGYLADIFFLDLWTTA